MRVVICPAALRTMPVPVRVNPLSVWVKVKAVASSQVASMVVAVYVPALPSGQKIDADATTSV